MDGTLHHALHLLYFLMAPLAMLLLTACSALVRRARRGSAPAPQRSRYSHALEQQELDMLLSDLERDTPRRGYSPISFRH
jgi:outer membrane biogenesis lipoprotein LolB